MTRWQDQPRDEDGQWVDDGIPNKENKMATRKKTTDETETATESTAPSSEDSSKSTDSETTVGQTDTTDSPGEGSPVAEDSQKTAAAGFTDHGTTTGLGDGDAFPDRPEFEVSDQTETATSALSGEEYERPKFRAVREGARRTVGISLFDWVGPEAIVISEDDLDDFKAFVAGL